MSHLSCFHSLRFPFFSFDFLLFFSDFYLLLRLLLFRFYLLQSFVCSFVFILGGVFRLSGMCFDLSMVVDCYKPWQLYMYIYLFNFKLQVSTIQSNLFWAFVSHSSLTNEARSMKKLAEEKHYKGPFWDKCRCQKVNTFFVPQKFPKEMLIVLANERFATKQMGSDPLFAVTTTRQNGHLFGMETIAEIYDVYLY